MRQYFTRAEDYMRRINIAVHVANASYATYRFSDKPWHPFDYRKFVTKRLRIAVTFKRRMRRVVRTTGAARRENRSD